MKDHQLKQLTDKQLIQRHQDSGDQECLEELYRRYHQKVRLYCYTILKDKETAEDITQDTFVRMVDRLSTLRNSDTFVSWLFRIARNLSLNYLQSKSKTKAERIEETLNLSDEIIDTEELEAKEHRIALMEILIDELPDEDRTMLKLKYLDKAGLKDIQEQFALSESAVKMRLSRARKKVLRLYDKKDANSERL